MAGMRGDFTSALINPGNVMNIQNEGPNGQLTCPLPPLTTGRYVRVSKLTGPGQSYSDTQTNIAEIQVFAGIYPAGTRAADGSAGRWEDHVELAEYRRCRYLRVCSLSFHHKAGL